MQGFLGPAVLTAALLCPLAGKLPAQQDRITSAIDNSQRVRLPGNVRPEALPQNDRGPVAPSFEMRAITVLLKPSASQQRALDENLAEQSDPNSPNYHKWLTPEQYADLYGASQSDVKKITAWLKSQGFTIDDVARGRNAITFSGTAQQVQNAFQTEIHRYEVNGKIHYANATDPTVPAALASIVGGFRGFSDFRLKPLNRQGRSVSERSNSEYRNHGGDGFGGGRRTTNSTDTVVLWMA